MDMGSETKLLLYKLVLNRYKDLISEKESRSISEIRQMVSPYNEFIRNQRERLLSDIIPYDSRLHFFLAAEKAMSYVRSIQTCEFAFSFFVGFEDMDRLKLGTIMDKAILLSALLRSLESEDARVLVTKKGKVFVRFSWKNSYYFFVPESGSLLTDGDANKIIIDDPVAYAFNDLVYENYEDV